MSDDLDPTQASQGPASTGVVALFVVAAAITALGLSGPVSPTVLGPRGVSADPWRDQDLDLPDTDPPPDRDDKPDRADVEELRLASLLGLAAVDFDHATSVAAAWQHGFLAKDKCLDYRRRLAQLTSVVLSEAGVEVTVRARALIAATIVASVTPSEARAMVESGHRSDLFHHLVTVAQMNGDRIAVARVASGAHATPEERVDEDEAVAAAEQEIAQALEASKSATDSHWARQVEDLNQVYLASALLSAVITLVYSGLVAWGRRRLRLRNRTSATGRQLSSVRTDSLDRMLRLPNSPDDLRRQAGNAVLALVTTSTAHRAGLDEATLQKLRAVELANELDPLAVHDVIAVVQQGVAAALANQHGMANAEATAEAIAESLERLLRRLA